MTTLLQIILIFIIFFPVKYLTWYITEEKGLPAFLNYQPWNCNTCATFWTLLTIYMTIWLSFSCLITGIGGITLTVLNAIAMWYHQKTHTIKI